MRGSHAAHESVSSAVAVGSMGYPMGMEGVMADYLDWLWSWLFDTDSYAGWMAHERCVNRGCR
jgi:hypothetical protein